MEYTEKVLDHFKNPRNVGVIEDADGVGEVGNPICGDMMKITIKVEEERIKDIKFVTFGCGAAIAVSSMVTEMAKGKTLEEALKITNTEVAEALGGLPKNKLHCSNLGADALKKAIMDYYERKTGKKKQKTEPSHTEYIGEREGTCVCPYCEEKLPKDVPFCTKCGRLIS
ncbi:MAG: Fe-S cluster assembly scaffold protein NifU [Desulfobacterota bacterium]|nr:Fe-S cluster assembly scaffold protein NifU [Thermodesulfobacteriota bacterium]MDW8001135.1 Fe-S cluster assembly scaffold protein NifU [Deltaproteobacteria bacterium]